MILLHLQLLGYFSSISFLLPVSFSISANFLVFHMYIVFQWSLGVWCLSCKSLVTL